MSQTLGIDLGTNSLGLNCWDKCDSGLLKDQISASVDTFINGVSSGSSSTRESSLAAERRAFRSTRRRFRSTKARKQATLRHLIQYGYCPLCMESLNKWRFDDKDNGYDRTFPTDKSFMQWLALDFNGDGKADYTSVYALRAELMDRDFDFSNEAERYRLGRALYHMACHRGFKSNKGTQAGDEEDADDDGTEPVSEQKKASGIRELMLANGLKTIGQAFHYIECTLGERVRNHPIYSVVRKQYREEIDEIFKRQSLPMDDNGFYKGLVSTKKHEGTIFYKRPLSSQKGKIAKCFLEPDKPRCYVCHPEFEEFRALQLINNIRICREKGSVSESLDDEDLRKTIFEKCFVNSVRDYFKFEEIRKVIETHMGLTLSKSDCTINYKDDTIVKGCPVTVRLKKLFNKGFKDIVVSSDGTDYTVEDIWHICRSADDDEWIRNFAVCRLHFDEKQTKSLVTLWNNMPDGYSDLSLKAITRINRMLRMGLQYSDAVMFAKLPDVIGVKRFEEIEDSIPDMLSTFNEEYESAAESVRRENAETASYFIQHPEVDYRQSSRKYRTMPVKADLFRSFLCKTFPDVKPYMWYKLYHHSDVTFYPVPPVSKDGNRYLADPIAGRTMPPSVKHSLFVLKHRINELIRKGDIDEHTRIVVETARDMCDSNMKWALDTYNKRREEENKKIAELITEMCPEHKNPDENEVHKARLLLEQGKQLNDYNEQEGEYYKMKVSVEKYRLWKEQEYISIYTGKPIPFSKLFTNEYDVEHTLPISKSFDDSMANKTICESYYNRYVKGNSLPTECPNFNEGKLLNGSECRAIKDSIVLERWKEKVRHLRLQVEYWDKKSRRVVMEDDKNKCVCQKYLYRKELDYWEGKIKRFFMNEIDDSFRNSQLNDTRIITRYAFHYLKSIFPKVFVERGETTACFRHIFGIEQEAGGQTIEWVKDRTLHYHHAIDALVLSLIPSARQRDEIMRIYYKMKEERKLGNAVEASRLNGELHSRLTAIGISNREVQAAVRKIKAELIVHHEIKDNKMARASRREYAGGKPTGRFVRSDVVKGQLHKDTDYGAIRYPISDEKGFVETRNGSFVYSDVTDGSDVRYVKREKITNAKLENIIDPYVRESIRYQMKMYGISNLSSVADKPMWMMRFKRAENGTLEPVMTTDADGKTIPLLVKESKGRRISPMRHVRCWASIKPGNVISIGVPERKSQKKCVNIPDRQHKERIYVEKGEFVCCIYYTGLNSRGREQAGYKFLCDFDIALLKRKHRELAKGCSSLKTFVELLPEYECQEFIVNNETINMTRRNVIISGMVVRLKDEGSGKSLSERTYVVKNFNYYRPKGVVWIVRHDVAKITDDKCVEILPSKFKMYEIVE